MHLPAPLQRQAIQSPIHSLALSADETRVKIYILSWSVLLTVMVGISRIYLGVHWPTDVVAGWIAGATWATLCLLVSRRIVFTNRFLDK